MMRSLRLRLPLFFLLGVTAFAAETAMMLMPPTDPVAPGHSARVDVVAINPGPREASFEVEPWLAGSLKTEASIWPVTLRASGVAPVAVSPGGFAVRSFTFDVPAEASGRTILEVKRRNGSILRAVLDIAAVNPSNAAAESAPTPLDKLTATTPATSALARNFAGRFQPNQPIYFIAGGGDQAAKFQFSFDYRLATLVFGSPGKETVTTLRAGYTQRSLWEIDGNSSPFYDTSYMPEIALNNEAPLPRHADQPFTWLGLRTGLQHESNGKDDADSRSLNIFYVRPRFVLGSIKDWFFVVLPEVYAYVGDLADNRDLKDYRGYGKLKIYAGRNDGPTLLLSTWAGKDFNHGTYQLDLAVPFQLRWLNIESFIYAQYFNGYGESLRAYNRKTDAFRIGLGLVR